MHSPVHRVMAAKFFLLALALFSAASAAPEARDSRIMGGTPVTIQDFPYVAALVYYYPGPAIYIQRCAGAIVSSWHVITTSFCFHGAIIAQMQVRAGSTHSLSGGMLANIRDVFLYPGYVANPRENDIAVVSLWSPLPIGGSINVLLLPAPGSFIHPDSTFKIVSWGFESVGGIQHQSLRSIFLDNVNLGMCSAAFAGINNVAISDSVLCAARFGNIGTCHGDSGAPMVLNNVLVGISSVFHECGTNIFPDVFTRVDRFTNWIMEVAQPPQTGARDGTVPVRIAAN